MPSIEQLLPYNTYRPWQAAQLLGIANSTWLRWRKAYGLKVFAKGGPRYERGETPGSLYHSMKTRGLNNYRDMTAEQIADEFRVDVCHVRWASKRFGFEYRHLKRGRRRNGIHPSTELV